MKSAEYKVLPRFSRQKHSLVKDATESITTKEVVLNVSLLQSHFGYPLHKSARAIGICATVLKK